MLTTSCDLPSKIALAGSESPLAKQYAQVKVGGSRMRDLKSDHVTTSQLDVQGASRATCQSPISELLLDSGTTTFQLTGSRRPHQDGWLDSEYKRCRYAAVGAKKITPPCSSESKPIGQLVVLE